ncbi:MAG TPA: protein YgfX, partial [Burkholderiales bacterium]|nr:protein YgfX [Burkholderiales bacterium]
LALSPSWNLAAAIVALHAAAAAAIAAVLPTAFGYALGAALLALGLAAAWARALLRSTRSVVAFDVSGRMELKNGATLAIAARPRHVSRFLVTLPLEGRVRRTILVTRDMLTAEEFRRLRLWALWEKLPRVAPEQLHFRA